MQNIWLPTCSVSNLNKLTLGNCLVLIVGFGLLFYRQSLNLSIFVGLSILEVSLIVQAVLQTISLKKTQKKILLVHLAIDILFITINSIVLLVILTKHIN